MTAAPDLPPEAPRRAAPSIGSVDRAIDVLLLFGRSLQPALGVTEIAHELAHAEVGRPPGAANPQPTAPDHLRPHHA